MPPCQFVYTSLRRRAGSVQSARQFTLRTFRNAKDAASHEREQSGRGSSWVLLHDLQTKAQGRICKYESAWWVPRRMERGAGMNRYWLGGATGDWVGYFGNLRLAAWEAVVLVWRAMRGEMYPWRSCRWFNGVDYLRPKDSHFEK